MSQSTDNHVSRRDMMKNTGRAAAATALVTAVAPRAFASESNTINVALVGCGGRGTGAAFNAIAAKNGPTKLVAMADVFGDRLTSSHGNLLGTDHGDRVDVSEDRKFIGFDAYKNAIDVLNPGDVVIFATPPAFRWVHFTYAIEKGVNVFMEKPVTVDGPTSRKMFALAEESKKKNLKVGVGLMCRHCPARRELFDRIQNGEIGDISMLRAYRMAGPTGFADTRRPREGRGDLEHQIRRFHAFLWASGGAVSDFLIHNIDESCWMKNAWPVEAKGSGGRHYRGDYIDQNFDVYSIEYTFADGAKLLVDGRTMPGCFQEFASYAHGSKGLAVISSASHWPARSRIYKGHSPQKSALQWAYPQPEPRENNPYQVEWEDLLQAIRDDNPYNEVKRGVEASLVTSMGRLAAHTGQRVTYDQMLNHDHEFAPQVGQLTLDSPAPLQSNEDGSYPVPMPGLVRGREYREVNA